MNKLSIFNINTNHLPHLQENNKRLHYIGEVKSHYGTKESQLLQLKILILRGNSLTHLPKWIEFIPAIQKIVIDNNIKIFADKNTIERLKHNTRGNVELHNIMESSIQQTQTHALPPI